jgi:SAM-dependent methyltransferase
MTSAFLFNATIAGAAVAAAFQLGLMEELDRGNEVDIASYCVQHDLHLGCTFQIARALQCFKIAVLDVETLTLRQGTAFHEINEDRGYFIWLACGYGYALQNLGRLARNENRSADMDGRSLVKRDGQLVGMAAGEYGRRHVDQFFNSVFVPRNQQIIADLGCGSAARIIEIAQQNPHVKAIGVDCDSDVIKLAARNVDASGLGGRIELVCDDVTQLRFHPKFESVTTIFSFFMGHDLWPRRRCLAVLENLRSCFPIARRMLICDTYRSDLEPSAVPPVFTLGFELLHAVMRQDIPSCAEWMSLFGESGWECVDLHPIGIPYSAIFDLKRRM